MPASPIARPTSRTCSYSSSPGSDPRRRKSRRRSRPGKRLKALGELDLDARQSLGLRALRATAGQSALMISRQVSVPARQAARAASYVPGSSAAGSARAAAVLRRSTSPATCRQAPPSAPRLGRRIAPQVRRQLTVHPQGSQQKTSSIASNSAPAIASGTATVPTPPCGASPARPRDRGSRRRPGPGRLRMRADEVEVERPPGASGLLSPGPAARSSLRRTPSRRCQVALRFLDRSAPAARSPAPARRLERDRQRFRVTRLLASAVTRLRNLVDGAADLGQRQGFDQLPMPPGPRRSPRARSGSSDRQQVVLSSVSLTSGSSKSSCHCSTLS
jgi:hypothetical protein